MDGSRVKYLFITQIFNLAVSTELNKGKIIRQGARITNNYKQIEEIIEEPIFKHNLGCFFYSEFSWSGTHYKASGKINGDFSDADDIGYTYCGSFLREVQDFLYELWKIKDHNAYVRDGFLLLYKDSYDDGLLYRSSLSEVYSRADLHRECVVFTGKELDTAIKNWEGLDIHNNFTEYTESIVDWKHPTPYPFLKVPWYVNTKLYKYLKVH